MLSVCCYKLEGCLRDKKKLFLYNFVKVKKNEEDFYYFVLNIISLMFYKIVNRLFKSD